MEFIKAINETSISSLAKHYKNWKELKTGIFNKSDNDVKNTIDYLTDNSGIEITDIETAKEMIKQYGVNPEEPKLLMALQSGVLRSQQKIALSGDKAKIEKELEYKQTQKQKNFNNRIRSKGWVN